MIRWIPLFLAVLVLSIATNATLVPDSQGAARKPPAKPSGRVTAGPVTVESSADPIQFQFDGVDATDSASVKFRGGAKRQNGGVPRARITIDSTRRNRHSITRDELRDIPVDDLGTTTIAPFPDPRDPRADASERQRLLDVPKEGGTTIAPLPAPEMTPRSSVRRRIDAESLRDLDVGNLHLRAPAASPITPPRMLPGRAPEYPQAARDAGVQGHVEVRVHVRSDGRVDDATILSGDAQLGRSALDFIRGSRFEPGTMAGKPVDLWIVVPVEFRLP